MKYSTPEGQKRYMNGLWNADAKGYAAGLDSQFRERDNPYRQFEHRSFWLEGFRRARTLTEKETSRD